MHYKTIPPTLSELISKFVDVAQSVYDAWQPNEDDYDEEVGYGGICHLIADEIVSILYDHDIEGTTVSSDHEVHVYSVCKLQDGIFLIDIPYSIYETGGGYTWKKIPDVEFDVDCITISKLSSDPTEYTNYTDQW